MDTNLISILILLVGVGLGGVFFWFVSRAKIRHSYDAAKAESAAQLATYQERLTAREHGLFKLQEAFDNELAERVRLGEQNANLRAELEGERRAAQERKESFKQAAEELSQKFKALSRDALKDNNESFLELARAKRELDESFGSDSDWWKDASASGLVEAGLAALRDYLKKPSI